MELLITEFTVSSSSAHEN